MTGHMTQSCALATRQVVLQISEGLISRSGMPNSIGPVPAGHSIIIIMSHHAWQLSPASQHPCEFMLHVTVLVQESMTFAQLSPTPVHSLGCRASVSGERCVQLVQMRC